MSRIRFSPRRWGFIALNTLREAMRQRILSVVVLLALMVVAGAHSLRDFHFGSPELKFLADLGGGAIALFGTILAVVLTTQLFFSEIERHTIQSVLAKPVVRAEFILGKLLAMAVILGAFCGLFTVLLAAVLRLRELSLLREWPEGITDGAVINYAHLAIVGLLLWLKLLVLAALTLLVASYARTAIFAIMAGFLIFILCHLQPLARAYGIRPGVSDLTRAIGCCARVFPNFQLFQIAESEREMNSEVWSEIGRVALYGLSYTAVAGALAVFCFQRREL